MDKIRASLSHPFPLAGKERQVSISNDSVLYPRDCTRIEALLKLADTRMYEDKQGLTSTR